MTLDFRRKPVAKSAWGRHWPALALAAFLALTQAVFAHGVTLGDQGYIGEIYGVKILPFIYLGAKHMVTGYDHILFLFGVIFFLYGTKQIAGYVSLFAIGHSTTMLIGVYFGIGSRAAPRRPRGSAR